MTTKYVAKDGKEFYNEKECIDHEITNEVNRLRDCQTDYVNYRLKNEDLFTLIELPSFVGYYGLEYYRVKYENQEQKNIVRAYFNRVYDYDFNGVMDDIYEPQFTKPQEFIVACDGGEWMNYCNDKITKEIKDFVKLMENSKTTKKK